MKSLITFNSEPVVCLSAKMVDFDTAKIAQANTGDYYMQSIDNSFGPIGWIQPVGCILDIPGPK